MGPSTFAIFWNLSFPFGLAVSALGLAVGHWIPKRREPDNVTRYIAGVGLILVGEGIWLVPLGLWPVFLGLVAFAVICGAVVCGAYILDEMKRSRVIGRVLEANLERD